MIVDGLMLAVVCVGYGYAKVFVSDPVLAGYIACACYITDNLLFALGQGRAVYVSRLTHSHEELTSTLAMGISINHIVSMIIPAVVGVIWFHFGHERVFAGAAVLALAVAVASSFVPRRAVLRA